MTRRTEQFPLGSQLTLGELDENPYPAYARLRDSEPISWCPATGMFLVTRYEDVRAVLLDTEHFVAGTDHSLLMDTFGAHMLTTEGDLHKAYKQPLLPLFRPAAMQARLQHTIASRVQRLIEGFRNQRRVDMRAAFASRLPVHIMLELFGFPPADEPRLRGWYDAFEAALANFTWNEDVRRKARVRIDEFHDALQAQLVTRRGAADDSLLSEMLAITEPRALSDEEIRRNASIIIFGGISTVEALILNSLYVLTERQDLLDRLRAQPGATRQFLDEVVRWSGPVQSATRHVHKATELLGVALAPGDTVNCMLAAANHDPGLFPDPERFDMDRDNLHNHLGFAIGVHHCLGSHLAKLEAGMALQGLLTALPGLRRSPGTQPTLSGYEFRQPRSLELDWDPG